MERVPAVRSACGLRLSKWRLEQRCYHVLPRYRDARRGDRALAESLSRKPPARRGICPPALRRSMSRSSIGSPPRGGASAARRQDLTALQYCSALLGGVRQRRGRKPDGSARKSRGIEIARRSDQSAYRAPSRARSAAGSDVTTRPVTSGTAPFGSASRKHAADQLALVARVKLHELCDGAAEIGIAGRRRIDELAI